MSATAQEHRLRVGGVMLRARVYGDGAGRPLLLLNGLGAPLELWQPLLNQLPAVPIIAFDAPGSGGSQTPLIPLSIAGHARLALDVADRLGAGMVDVLGLSLGGMVAQQLARIAPGRVGHLVLASTSCGWGSIPGSPAALLAVTTPNRYYSRTIFEAVAPIYIGGRESRDRSFLHGQAATRIAHPPSVRGYLYQAWAAAFWSSLLWLSELPQPTLVIAGLADPLVPAANAKLLAARLRNAQAYLVPGGGHLCLLERAQLLAPVIRRFIAQPLAADRAAADA
jgi:pimeloyl-ACP methyl ester carboxylesterase